MDVRCTQCGIAYDFDDAKVTAAVTVKCTSCGHVFKVKREEAAVLPSTEQLPSGKGESVEWMVKRVDGHILRFKELTRLQKWIVARKVGRDDEISRTGKTWKRLGELAELASFFQVVDAARAPHSGPPLASIGQVNIHAGDRGTLDGDDPVWRLMYRRKNALLAVVLVAAGIGALALSTTLYPAAPIAHTGPAVDAALHAIRQDQLEGLRAARSSFDAPTDAVARATQVRLDVAIASHLHAQARALEVLASTSEPVSLSAAAAKNDEAAQTLAQAYATLTQVHADSVAAPQPVELHLAAAAYQLETGAFAEQRAELENARAAARASRSFAPQADVGAEAAIDAEIAIQQALADAAAGIDHDAAAAFARMPGSNDGRLRYARAALTVAALAKAPTEPDLLSARAAVTALPAPDERRELLLRIVDAKAAAAAPPTLAADEASSEGAAAPLASAGAEGGDASYELVMQRAERAGANGRSSTAYDLFVRASKLDADAARPWLGIGWAALDLGRNTEAVRAFEKALAFDDGLADAQFGLAEALVTQGRNDEAKQAYEKYLSMEANGRDAAIAKRALELLE